MVQMLSLTLLGLENIDIIKRHVLDSVIIPTTNRANRQAVTTRTHTGTEINVLPDRQQGASPLNQCQGTHTSPELMATQSSWL